MAAYSVVQLFNGFTHKMRSSFPFRIVATDLNSEYPVFIEYYDPGDDTYFTETLTRDGRQYMDGDLREGELDLVACECQASYAYVMKDASIGLAAGSIAGLGKPRKNVIGVVEVVLIDGEVNVAFRPIGSA